MNAKRILTYILVTLVVAAVYFGLVHLILVITNLQKPAPSTVYGLTYKRQFALAALGLALLSIIAGWRSFRRSAAHTPVYRDKAWPATAIIAGVPAVIGSVFNLATSTGGPGSGNGVLGSSQGLILGLTGIVLASLSIVRSRRKKINT
jgi:hypothetical protein